MPHPPSNPFDAYGRDVVDPGILSSGVQKPPSELNTVANLVLSIRESEPVVQRRFARLLGGPSIQDTPTDVDIQAEGEGNLVRGNDLELDADEIKLVALTRSGRTPPAAKIDAIESDSGTPDAMVIAGVNDQQVGVVLEAKTGTEEVGVHELGKYANQLGVGSKAVRGLPWREIYEFAQREARRTEDDISEFLLQNFADHLCGYDLDVIVAGYRDEERKKAIEVQLDEQEPVVTLRSSEFKESPLSGSDTETFTETQLADLLSEIPYSIRERTFVEFDYDALLNWIEEDPKGVEIGRTPCGESEKYDFYQIVVSQDDYEQYLLTFRPRDEDDFPAEQVYSVQFGRVDLPRMFGEEGNGPGLSPEQRRAIFVDHDFERIGPDPTPAD